MATEIHQMVSLGGMCWVAKLLDGVRNSPCGPFDKMGTTPQMVADILNDKFIKLVDPWAIQPRGPRQGHYDHDEYSFYKYLPRSAVDAIAASNRSVAIFQHDGEHGVAELVATIRRRVERFRNFVWSPGWKVFVWGAALPYSMWVERKTAVRDMFEQQMKSLYEYMQNDGNMERFVLVGIIVVHSVPNTCQDPQTELLSGKWRNAKDALLMRYVQVKSTLRGATWHGESACRDQAELADFLRKLVNKDIWQMFYSEDQPFWASDLLGLHTWSNPLGGGGNPQSRPSMNEPANILGETEAYTESKYTITAYCGPPSVFPSSREFVKIVSDSTLLNCGERWKSMVCGNDTLAVIAGAYGMCYADGGMDHVPPLAGTLIAYVPADDCHPRHKYGAHATAQRSTFSGKQYLMPTPTLMQFSEYYTSKYKQQLFKSTGVHLTKPGQKWLIWAMSEWARARGVTHIMCVGWNASNPAQEYECQLAKVVPVLA